MSLLFATMQYSHLPRPSSICLKAILCLSVLSLLFTITSPIKTVKLPPNVTVPALIAFGDSIADTGNNNYITTVAKSNFPPYGKDFKGGIPTGRFSNGRVATDLIAEVFSIKQYVPAYLDPNLDSENLLTGVSFASGGSGYDPLTSKLSSVIALTEQLEYFKEYIKKLQQLVGEEKTQFIIANSLFINLSGSVDLAVTYYGTPLRSKQYDIDSYTNLLANLASSFIQELYNLGARRMLVSSAAPVGCLPSQRTLRGGIVRQCVETLNHGAQLFNSKLSAVIDSLAHKLPDSIIVYLNIYDPLLDIIQSPRRYGFEQVAKGCCGTGLIEVATICNKFDPVCPDDSKYLFWDSYHPTERGYETLINLIIDKYSSLLPGVHK